MVKYLKSINMTQYFNKMKNKSHSTILIDIKETFDKI